MENTNPTSTNSVSNPLANQFNVVVSVPQAVNVKLVDASLLSEFEIWMYLSSILLNVSTGFWVSYIQNTVVPVDKILCWTSVCFTILFLFTGIVAVAKRIRMNKKSKDIELNTSISNQLN